MALAQNTGLLAGPEDRVFGDIDSLLRPVYGHHKQGASFGHATIAGRALPRKGLSPLVTTLSTARSAPVVTEMRLPSATTGSARAAAPQVTAAIGTAGECGASGKVMVGELSRMRDN